MVKQRENTRHIEPRKDKDGRLLCLVLTCNNHRCRRKNSTMLRNYCNKHSHEDMEQFTSWKVLRLKCLERDDYTCVKCGDAEINPIADHIKPIALGGDEWDINNLQTLCQKCNKIKTRQDAKDIAKLRRVENIIVDGQITLPTATKGN